MNATDTAKQQAVRSALEIHARGDGESKNKWCKRVGAIAGCSSKYVWWQLELVRCEQIGANLRAKEAEEEKLRCKVMPFTGNVGPVRNFQGWAFEFGKLEMLATAYLTLARERGDAYAAAFLMNIKENCERGQKRAASNIRL